MKLMRNKYLKFEEIDSGIGIVRNLTTFNILPTIPVKYFGEEYVLQKKLEDDRLLEGISQELYNSTDYWDILLVYNGMTSLDNLPANYDTVLVRANTEFQGWVVRGDLMHSNLTDIEKETKYKAILANEIEINEKYRYLKYLSANDVSSLLAELGEVENKVRIDADLIIG